MLLHEAAQRRLLKTVAIAADRGAIVRPLELPTADVGSPVAQLGGQLSGGEFAHPAVAGRP